MMQHSPILTLYNDRDFEIGEHRDMRIALRAQQNAIRATYVADVSALRRRLIVGRGAVDCLARHGFDQRLGLLQNTSFADGAILVRLHREQYLFLDDFQSTTFDEVFALDEGRDGDALVMRYEAAEIACGGPRAHEVIAELCSVDLSNVTNRAFIPCRFAHCEASLRLFEGASHFRLICSPADARSLFSVLLEAVREVNGMQLGFDDCRASIQRAH